MEMEKELNDQQLSEVNGGTHLSSSEVKALVPGRRLIWENIFGKDLAEVEFISYEDPGLFSLLKCTVKIIRVFSSDGYIEMSSLNDAGQCVIAQYRAGDVCSLPRDLLDFPERA